MKQRESSDTVKSFDTNKRSRIAGIKISAQELSGSTDCFVPVKRDLLVGGEFPCRCMAHARRKFFDLFSANQHPIAQQALERIGQLYAIEAQGRALSVEQRYWHQNGHGASARVRRPACGWFYRRFVTLANGRYTMRDDGMGSSGRALGVSAQGGRIWPSVTTGTVAKSVCRWVDAKARSRRSSASSRSRKCVRPTTMHSTLARPSFLMPQP